MGVYNKAIECFRKLKSEKGYWNYNYPHALYLVGEYMKALSILQQFYSVEKRYLWKLDLQFVFVCLDKAFNFYENKEMIFYYLFNNNAKRLNSSMQDGFLNIVKRIKRYKIKLKLFEYSDLIHLVISAYGNWETAIIKLEQLRKQESIDKIHNRIKKCNNQSWILKEVKEENLRYSEEEVQKLLSDGRYVFQLIKDKNLEALNRMPPEDWYSYISHLYRKNGKINGKDIYNFYSFLYPDLKQ